MKYNIRRIWLILSLVTILMLVIGMVAGFSDVKQYAKQMEALMNKGDYDAALQIGCKSDKTDSLLTALRVEALYQQHRLGDELFTYPISGSGRDMKHCGGDKMLCGYLIDCQLDQFVKLLPTYYPINSSLPKHYQEALVLYKHLRAQPIIVFNNLAMEADFDEMKSLQQRYPKQREWLINMQTNYKDTYWYYYFCGKAINKLQNR